MELVGTAGWSGTTGRRQVTFKLYAPDVKAVSVAGDFDGWDVSAHELSRKENGLWVITIELSPGSYEYKFFVDGEWRVDPDAVSYNVNGYGTLNCIITVD